MVKILKAGMFDPMNFIKEYSKKVILFTHRDYFLHLFVDENNADIEKPYLSANFDKEHILKIKEFINKVENDDRCNSCWENLISQHPNYNDFTCKDCGKLVNVPKSFLNLHKNNNKK